MSLRARFLLLCLGGLLLAGCGRPTTATYVDPNAPSSAAGLAGRAPAQRFGADVAERARSIEHLRAALVAARDTAMTDPAAAQGIVRSAIEADLTVLEPRLRASDASLARRLRSELEHLAARPMDAPGAGRRADLVHRSTLTAAERALIPPAARLDPGFRGLVLFDALQDASMGYEEAFDGGRELVAPGSYHLAYGLVADARDSLVDVLPEPSRSSVRSRLERVARERLSDVMPPTEIAGTEAAVGVLGIIADDVVTGLRIDPTYPAPAASAPGQLESLKRAIAAAAEARSRGQLAPAAAQLRIADRSYLHPAASSIAVVSPDLLWQLERGLLMTLPIAFGGSGNVDATVLDMDSVLDEALAAVNEEIELQREQRP